MAIIEVNHVTKEYQLGQLQSIKQTLQNGIARLRGQPPVERKLFKALDDVDFHINEGEVVGIIGTNGAGKSTLLKLLAGITKPTQGKVKVDGSVAPLIEVGAGLNPELTGRENIYLNSAILGISKKTIKKELNRIVEFAELEEFIDTPVKRYSSGMKVRLGFSIATNLNADILIVDEVLAVGDLAFQRKCFDRMEDMIKHRGKTVLLVSHNMRQVERLCNRVILLDDGKILIDDDPKVTCESFYQRSNEKIAKQTAQIQNIGRNVRKSGEIDIVSIEMINRNGVKTNELIMGESVTIRGTFNAIRQIEKSEVVYGFHTTDFVYISSMGTAHIEERPDLTAGKNVIECHITHLPLVPGVYCLRIGILDKFRREMFYAEMLSVFTVRAKKEQVSKMPALGLVEIPVRWSFHSDIVSNESKHLAVLNN